MKIRKGKAKCPLHVSWTPFGIRLRPERVEPYLIDEEKRNKVYFGDLNAEIAEKLLILLRQLGAEGLVLRLQPKTVYSWSVYNRIVGVGDEEKHAKKLNRFIEILQEKLGYPIEFEDDHLWDWLSVKVPDLKEVK